MTAHVLATAFGAMLRKVDQSAAVMDRKKGLEQARTRRFDYYAEPSILHWEDRNTAWSGRSDVIIVKVTVLNAKTGDQIDSATIDGKSQWFTFTNEPPEDLLAEPFSRYAAELVE